MTLPLGIVHFDFRRRDILGFIVILLVYLVLLLSGFLLCQFRLAFTHVGILRYIVVTTTFRSTRSLVRRWRVSTNAPFRSKSSVASGQHVSSQSVILIIAMIS